jgi:hypothetical protein
MRLISEDKGDEDTICHPRHNTDDVTHPPRTKSKKLVITINLRFYEIEKKPPRVKNMSEQRRFNSMERTTR